MLIDSYDQGVIDVLDIYMKDCQEITLVEFGRGNGALAEKYLNDVIEFIIFGFKK